MKKIYIVLMIVAMVAYSGSVLADQAYGGFGLNPIPAQQDYVADGVINFNLAYEPSYESLEGWRFSYVMTSFKQSDVDSNTTKSQIFSAEQLYILNINPDLSLIGAFGPGLFVTYVNTDKSRNGTSIGLSVEGSIRYVVSSFLFLEGAYHYKNCAVIIDEGTMDAGYQGFFMNVGFIF
jgi:hypothetical protein